MKRVTLITTPILAAFLSCGQPGQPCDGRTLQDSAYICPNLENVDFDLSFGRGAYIGTSLQETLILTNGSTANLEIEEVSKSGDGTFAITTDPEALPASITGKKSFLVNVTFTPTEPGLRTGRLIVRSNVDFPDPDGPISAGYPDECVR